MAAAGVYIYFRKTNFHIHIIFFPGILNYNIITPVYIHNIHNLGIGFFLVIFTVVVVGVISYFRAMNIATKNRNEFNS